MKKQVLFVHGGDSFSNHEDFLVYLRSKSVRDPYGFTRQDWPDTLREALGPDYELFRLSMPNSANADYEAWKIWFERHFEYLSAGVILIGWSLGGMFLAKYLIENVLPFETRALYLMATPCGEYNDEFNNDCGSFRFDTGLLAVLADRVTQIEIWHSEDDFVVPFEHAKRFKSLLPTANLRVFSDKTHFLVPELPELVEHIKTL